ncbi:MAG: AsmA-like C-terminal region-containing protein [Polaribacter sp.]|nr:AsmA-like C-terminal region-containing protein [Polaribacter sp.]
MAEIKKKKSLKKRILQWSLISILSLLIVIVAIPFLFKDKIVKMVVSGINENINATLTYQDTDISLFADFPNLSLIISDIAIINKEPFLGDTLFAAEKLNANMKITTLFKKENEAIELQSIATKNGQINILFNKDDIGNYDIALKKEVEKESLKNRFSLDINQYELENIRFMYFDENSKNKVIFDSIYHTGSGNFAEDIFNLDTKSTTKLSLFVNDVNYVKNVNVSLDAVLEIDLKNSKYTFKENKGFINQLALDFDGFVQLVNENQLYDITFNTPTSDFKNFLALLPKQYSGNLKSIKTEGNFDLNGVVKGTLSETTIPGFDITIASKNAMFKYDELPKSVQKITIDAKIINKTGYLKDTYLNLNNLTFKIDEDVFAANGNIANITTNPSINLAAKGTINLANIGKVYPAPFKKQLEGILKADIVTKFDMDAIEKGNYERINNAGKIAVTSFKYEGEEVAKPFFIDKTSITFNTKSIQLNEFNAKTGNSDIAINGNLDNFYGFLFKDQELKGNFNMNSNNFVVSDFLAKTESTTENKQDAALKIPAFLDCKFIASAKNVTYDNLKLTNVSGTIFVKDEAVNLQNIKSDIFGGSIGFNGNVSTKGTTSKFAMDLNLQQLNISESFSNIDMLKSIAPIAKTIEGKINSTIKVSGNLNDDMTPNLKTISGDLFGKLLSPKLNASNSKALSLLGDKLSFLDVSKLNLDGINAFLSFENGQVTVKPIPLKYNDIAIEIGGKHSFDNTMNYDVVFDVPVKYLGAEITNLISKLSSKDAEQLKSIPVKANLAGSFTSPNFSSNLKQATTNLMTTIVEKQKQQLIDKGKDKLTNLLGVTTKEKDSTDTTKTTTKDIVNDKVKGTLSKIFGKKKDTTKNKN